MSNTKQRTFNPGDRVFWESSWTRGNIWGLRSRIGVVKEVRGAELLVEWEHSDENGRFEGHVLSWSPSLIKLDETPGTTKICSKRR